MKKPWLPFGVRTYRSCCMMLCGATPLGIAATATGREKSKAAATGLVGKTGGWKQRPSTRLQ